MKPLLGGKGANLAEMTRIGLPVPPVSRFQPKSALTFTRIPRLPPDDAGRSGGGDSRDWNELWARLSVIPKHAIAGRGPIRGARFHAGNDGHVLNLGLNDEPCWRWQRPP